MSTRRWRIDLLPRDLLIKTGPVDEGDWHYRPVLWSVMRRRNSLLQRLLRGEQLARLLDLGDGSGILMPALSKYCNELHGIDIHLYNQEVGQRLSSVGVHVNLTRGLAEAMPFESSCFDAVVATSSLEFVDDIHAALKDVARVLRPGGVLMFVSPRKTIVGIGCCVGLAEGKALLFSRRDESTLVQPSRLILRSSRS
jgi:SAM-dependent methyltransferase